MMDRATWAWMLAGGIAAALQTQWIDPMPPDLLARNMGMLVGGPLGGFAIVKLYRGFNKKPRNP